jgi:hypothetical protein
MDFRGKKSCLCWVRYQGHQEPQNQCHPGYMLYSILLLIALTYFLKILNLHFVPEVVGKFESPNLRAHFSWGVSETYSRN